MWLPPTEHKSWFYVVFNNLFFHFLSNFLSRGLFVDLFTNVKTDKPLLDFYMQHCILVYAVEATIMINTFIPCSKFTNSSSCYLHDIN